MGHQKEARMKTMWYNQSGTEEPAKINITMRNQDGTFKNSPTYERMESHATSRLPRLNLPRDEYKLRMAQGLCLRCGKTEQRIQNCNKGKSGIIQRPRWSHI